MEISTRSLRRCLYGLGTGYGAACAIAWPYLPERMPLHFGFTGRVTSWVQSSSALWFLLPAVALAITAFILAASGPPEAWKLSAADMKRFRLLSADAQAQVRDTFERNTLIVLMLFLGMIISLQVGILTTALKGADRMPVYPRAGMVLSLVAMLVVGVRGQRRLRSQIGSAAASRESFDPGEQP